MAAGRDRWGFLVGLAAGAVGALAAPQLLSPAPLPPPYVGELPLAPAPPEVPVPIFFSPSIDAYGPKAQLPTLEIVLLEASLAAPEPWQVKVPALMSKVRLAGPPPSVLLRMQRAPSRSVSRSALFLEHRVDGRDTGGARIADLARAFDSAMHPVTPGRPGVGKPARPQEPARNGWRPRPASPPTAEPRPSTSPKQATQGSRPPTGSAQRSRDARPGRTDGKETATRDRQRAEPGSETAGRASHAKGAPDHAQGSGRGAGSGPGGRNESHSSGRGNDSGKGKSDDSKSGNGNGGGGKGGSGKGGNGHGGGGGGKGRG